MPIYEVSTVSIGNIAATALANNANTANEISDTDMSSSVPDAQDIEKDRFEFRSGSIAAYRSPAAVLFSETVRTSQDYVATK